MTNAEFWSIIEKAKGDADRVTAALKKLKPAVIEAFSRVYWEKHAALHRWDVWGAAYVINGGCSDDSFHYFKAWAIGKGQKVYEALAADPDSIGPFVKEKDLDEGCDNESLNYSAVEAYESLTGSHLDYETHEDDDPAGIAWEEEDLPGLFPKLSAKFAE